MDGRSRSCTAWSTSLGNAPLWVARLETSGPRARRAPWVLSRRPCLAPSLVSFPDTAWNDHMTAVNTAGRSGEVVGGPHRDRRADPGGRPSGDPPVGPYLRMRLAVGRDLDVAGRVVADDALAEGGVQRGPQGCSGRRATHRRSAVAAQHVARGVDAQRDAGQRWTEAVVQVAARSPALLLPAHHQPIAGSSQGPVPFGRRPWRVHRCGRTRGAACCSAPGSSGATAGSRRRACDRRRAGRRVRPSSGPAA